MKKLVAIIVLGSLVACNGNDYPEQDKSIVPANSQSTTISPSPNVMPVNADKPNSDVQVLNSPVPMPSQAAPAVTMAGMNPAHGEPNHRCDIAVGAPLNSPASNANTAAKPQVQTVTAPATPTVSPVPTKIPVPAGNGSVKLNPAHGEPGHDCAKSVGAPLN